MKECISALIDKRQVGEHRKLVLDDNYTVLPFVLPALIAPDKKEPLLILEKGRLHTPSDLHRGLLFINPYPQLAQDANNTKSNLQELISEFLKRGEPLHNSYLRAYFLHYPNIYEKGYRIKDATEYLKDVIRSTLKDCGFLMRSLQVPSVKSAVLIKFNKEGRIYFELASPVVSAGKNRNQF